MHNELSSKMIVKRLSDREEDIRGCFFRDQTAIIHSMPFRRLKHKTQVFFSPNNDHICTRIEHVLHVATISSTICKGLNYLGWDLDSELAYAIGLGHDLGHAPFGHAGEKALSNCLEEPFMHEINSYRVVASLANEGRGLNLTYGVKDGIISHNGETIERKLSPDITIKDFDSIKDRKSLPSTFEGCIVRFADKIAYLGRDMEDAILSNLVTNEDIPQEIKTGLGSKNGHIINTLVSDLIQQSHREGAICFSEEIFKLYQILIEFNYESIYKHKSLTNYKVFIDRMIRTIYEYLKDQFIKHGFDYDGYKNENIELAKAFGKYLEKMQHIYLKENNLPNQLLSDYLSGMTDGYAIKAMKEICIPNPL